MKHVSRTLPALVAALALAACSSVPLDETKVETKTGSSVVPSSTGSSQTRVAPVDATMVDPASLSNLPKVVYFDFDSYVVKDQYRPVIEANAKALTGNATRRMSVAGHTDDRGSSEYNLALGQRRAEAVVKSMELLGAKSNQLEAVSFGKERPAAQGEGEEAWAKNRRAEIAAK